jgi:N-acetylglucosamine kinase-like BadF-type ATPase
MKFRIGIEGGGSTTRVLAQKDDWPPDYMEAPISVKVRNGDFRASAVELAEFLEPVLPLPENIFSPTVSIAMGLSGMSREEDQEALKQAIRAIPELSKAKFHVESDATLTLSAVLPEGEEGILLIAGTGSVVFFQPRGGTPRRLGGWGPLISDEGSGYRIGLRALNYYLRVLDGVYPPEPLSVVIANLLPEKLREDRIGIARLAERDATFVASLTPYAFAASEPLGPVRDLVYEELIDLVTLIFPVFFPNVMSGEVPYKLFLCGSIAKHPIMLDILGNAFDDTDIAPIQVDDRVPCMKALEIARGL